MSQQFTYDEQPHSMSERVAGATSADNDSYYSNIQLTAASGIATDPPETELTELLSFLKRENAVRREQFLKLRRIAIAVLCIPSVIFVEHLVRTGRPLTISLASFAWFGVFAGGVVATRRQVRATVRLSQLKDRRVLGPMIDALEFSQIRMRRLAREALIELLPQVRESDSTLLQPHHRQILNKALRRKQFAHSTARLKCAILAAYEQIGDETALPIVEELASQYANTPRSVHDAALACLPSLRSRSHDSLSTRELLRGSTPTARDPSTLIRPSSSREATKPDELLRQEHRWIDNERQ